MGYVWFVWFCILHGLGDLKMKKYHDQKTVRERLARPLYRIPFILRPIWLERILVLKIIPFIEGKNPHYKHLGRNCPCMTEGS